MRALTASLVFLAGVALVRSFGATNNINIKEIKDTVENPCGIKTTNKEKVECLLEYLPKFKLLFGTENRGCKYAYPYGYSYNMGAGAHEFRDTKSNYFSYVFDLACCRQKAIADADKDPVAKVRCFSGTILKCFRADAT